MPVPILVDEIFGGYLADRSEPLWAPRRHPDEIPGRDRIPGITEPVDTASLQHDESVLHDMHFHRAERGAGLVHHGVHRKIETRSVRKQAFHLQIGIIVERVRRNGIFG